MDWLKKDAIEGIFHKLTKKLSKLLVSVSEWHSLC